MLDTETTGFPRDGGNNEPIQIVALLFRNGVESKREYFRKYYLPKSDITSSAEETHGLTKRSLVAKGAGELTKG